MHAPVCELSAGCRSSQPRNLCVREIVGADECIQRHRRNRAASGRRPLQIGSGEKSPDRVSNDNAIVGLAHDCTPFGIRSARRAAASSTTR